MTRRIADIHSVLSTTRLMSNYLLCCDWGTSFFRLQLLRYSDDQCVGELIAREGIAGTFDAWRKTGAINGLTREHFFRRQLRQQIQVLAQQVSVDLTKVPLVISGMASSSIGMEEVPYATLPFALDGSQASVRYYEAQPDFPHEMLLISGVRSQQDVMRGEETQLIGLIALLSQAGVGTTEAIFVFPGTHSKHLYVQNGRLLNFTTYMTGELFDLMAHQSLLRESVEVSSLTTFSASNKSAFRRGVRQATTSGLLNGLFTTRTNQLFETLTKSQNAFYLSGLIIGAELYPLLTQTDWPLVICSGSRLTAFYELAIDELTLSARTTILPAELIDKAASKGQMLLFRNQTVKETTR